MDMDQYNSNGRTRNISEQELHENEYRKVFYLYVFLLRMRSSILFDLFRHFRVLFPRYHIASLKVWDSYYAKSRLEVML